MNVKHDLTCSDPAVAGECESRIAGTAAKGFRSHLTLRCKASPKREN